MFSCRICDNTEDNRGFVARERMFGFDDEFEYFECARCGCVQIVEVPEDLEKYYPENYYAFNRSCEGSSYGRFKKRRYLRYLLRGEGLIGWLIAKRSPPESSVRDWTRRAGVQVDDAILDVGSGGGEMVSELIDAGFSNVLGIDPFITAELSDRGRPIVLKRTLEEVDGSYDFIVLNHSFEHINEPQATLQHVHRLLRANRVALLRVPLAGSLAWRKYQSNWVQLDAPRHLFLHTPSSVKLVASEVGFEIVGIDYDSTAFQFWGSEQYARGIALMGENSYLMNPERSIFSKRDLRAFEVSALQLNRMGEGDQAGFYLLKT